jgi:hypothetical protein
MGRGGGLEPLSGDAVAGDPFADEAGTEQYHDDHGSGSQDAPTGPSWSWLVAVHPFSQFRCVRSRS